MSSSLYEGGGYLVSQPSWHAEDSHWKAREVFHDVRRHRLASAKVVEIGCGAGRVLWHLWDMLEDCVTLDGFETAPDALAMCRKVEGGKLRFHDRRFPERNDYDIVMVLDVVEHVEDYFGFLREVRKCGRHKIFHVPLEMNALAVVREGPLSEAGARVGHLHFFSKGSILSALARTGYRVIGFRYTGSGVGVGARRFRSQVASVPRRVLFGISGDFAARTLGGYSLMIVAV